MDLKIHATALLLASLAAWGMVYRWPIAVELTWRFALGVASAWFAFWIARGRRKSSPGTWVLVGCGAIIGFVGLGSLGPGLPFYSPLARLVVGLGILMVTIPFMKFVRPTQDPVSSQRYALPRWMALEGLGAWSLAAFIAWQAMRLLETSWIRVAAILVAFGILWFWATLRFLPFRRRQELDAVPLRHPKH